MILDRDVPEWESLCGCRYCDRDIDIDAEMCKKCREWHTEVEDDE